MSRMIKHIVILGAPGSGKGTQAKKIESDYGWVHLSTGDMFRKAIKQNTPAGKEAKSVIEKGELASDTLTCRLVKDRLKEDDCRNGFILDGFPRTYHQCILLDEIVESLNVHIDNVVYISINEDTVIRRLSKRLTCKECGAIVIADTKSPVQKKCTNCGGKLIKRDDDKLDTIRHRLKLYQKNARPIVSYYENKNLLSRIDGLGTVNEVYGRIVEVLDGSAGCV